MESVVASLLELLQTQGPQLLLSLVSFVAGALLGRLQAWRQWTNRAFYDRLNVSLNFVADGQLQIRTLLERSAAEVFQNEEMRRRVVAAAGQGQGPLLALSNEDYWYYLNAVLNAVSERFAEGHIRQEAKVGTAQTYLLFLTSETEGPVRQRKVRAMMVREALLLEAQKATPEFKNAFHETRWDTLRQVAEEWVQSSGQSPRIRKISVCV